MVGGFATTTVGRALGATTNAIFLALFALYLWCPVHRFPEARPFHGEHWYNPYGGVTSATPWQKVNFHAHSQAWGGLTNGHGSADDLLQRYRALGYDVAPVSNYQEISRATGANNAALTVYEHGFNVRKAHFLAISPRAVDWLDYPLFQSRDEEQHRIDRLRATSALVIMAHPRLRHAFGPPELRALTGYAAMEIGSNAAASQDAWDLALDAGRPVWGVANDDTHDVFAPNEIGYYWTMFASPTIDAASLTSALRRGSVYAVFGHEGRADVALESVALIGDTLTIELRGGPAAITLIGPGGKPIAQVTGARSARWILPCEATWVRVVARTPSTQLFLEPFIRSEDGRMPVVAARGAEVPTTLRRLLAIVLLLGAAVPNDTREVYR